MTASPHLARFAPAVAAGIVLLAIPTAWAVADTDVSSSTTSGERVMRLNWTLTEARDGEVAPEGLSSGDTFQAAFLLAGRSTGSADYARTASAPASCATASSGFPTGTSTSPRDQSTTRFPPPFRAVLAPTKVFAAHSPRRPTRMEPAPIH